MLQLKDDLTALVQEGTKRAHQIGREVLLNYSVPLETLADPLELLAQIWQTKDTAFFWEQPQGHLSMVGLGACRMLRATGEAGFRAASRMLSETITAFAGDSTLPASRARDAGPLLFGGFSFDPEGASDDVWRGFPASMLVVPHILVASCEGKSWLTVNSFVNRNSDPAAVTHECVDAVQRTLMRAAHCKQPDEAPAQKASLSKYPDDAAWLSAVRQTIDDVQSGRLTKAVLARRCDAVTDREFCVPSILKRLRNINPGCRIFALQSGAGWFLGATPELLAKMRGQEVTSASVAGSVARGSTVAEDSALAEVLLTSDKERREQAIVTDYILHALLEVCDWVNAGEVSVLKLPTVQHLFTPIRARVASGHNLLDIIARLHPTPAVGGTPREIALPLIRAREGFNRGWYAGAIGWIDLRGDGEFAVAIRSALVRGNVAHLFAGAGIVADSVPEAELAETDLKLQNLLGVLSGR